MTVMGTISSVNRGDHHDVPLPFAREKFDPLDSCAKEHRLLSRLFIVASRMALHIRHNIMRHCPPLRYFQRSVFTDVTWAPFVWVNMECPTLFAECTMRFEGRICQRRSTFPRRIGRRCRHLPPFKERTVQLSPQYAHAFHYPFAGRRNPKKVSLVCIPGVCLLIRSIR